MHVKVGTPPDKARLMREIGRLIGHNPTAHAQRLIRLIETRVWTRGELEAIQRAVEKAPDYYVRPQRRNPDSSSKNV